MDKNARLDIRCTEQEKLRWKQEAKNSGLSFSDYARARLNGNTKISAKKLHPSTMPTVLTRHIAAIGNNLNQLTHWVHIHKNKAESSAVIHGIEALRIELKHAVTQSSVTGHVD